jgi:uncharacterized protein (DUF1501 family)
MKRRTFIQGMAAGAAMTPVLLDRIYAKPSTPASWLSPLGAESNDKILIFVQMFGGNDGLNTVVPAENDIYYNTLRPTISIAKANCYNYGPVYLNPGLALKGGNSQTGFGGLLENGYLAIIQNIGYNDPNLSHFRSSDIWLSGINDNNATHPLNSGWLGRYLDTRNQLPTDPLAINFGGFSLALTNESGKRMGIEVNDPSGQSGGLLGGADTLDDQADSTHYKDEYAFVQDIANRSNTYAQGIKDAYTKGKAKLKGVYGSDSFAKQMASVAALIAGGLQTRIYYVSIGGFDTHVSQTGDDHTGAGSHMNLLHYMSDAIAQFQYDLLQLENGGMSGISKRVAGLTMSEFGRRPSENGSLGTDHGAASVQFLFGEQVTANVWGHAPNLSDLDDNGDLRWEVDFRTIYGGILMDWFGLSKTDMQSVLKDNSLEPFYGLFKSQGGVPQRNDKESSLSVYPNPLSGSGQIAFSIPSDAHVTIQLSSVDGAIAREITARSFAAGSYTLPISADLPNGSYILSMRAGSERLTRMVTVIR